MRKGCCRRPGLGWLWIVLAILAAAGAEAIPASQRTVILLLFDGFAPALVDANETPALDRMGREGVWSHGLSPAFPSISLINAVTVSTGCWPARHGIVTNLFIDPEKGLYDHSPDADWLLGCEHLHQAAERQDVRSAALAWVGSHSRSRGALATFVENRTEDLCSQKVEPRDRGRAREIVRLLGLPGSERPRLILGYFCGPDGAAHFAGMDAGETRAAVRQSDEIIAMILEAIESLPHGDEVSLLVTTDHGMAPVTHVVNMQRILGHHDVDARAVSTGTTSFLYFDDPADVEPAFTALSGYDEFEVLRREALPDYAQLGSSRRVGDLIVSAHPPYFIEDLESWPSWLRWLGRIGPRFIRAGFALAATHGYPSDTPGMEGILYAWGAGFAQGRRIPRVRNIDLHPTVAYLLGIESGRPVDGAVDPALLP